MTDEVKGAVDGLMRAFEEFKATNDAKLKEIQKGGADPITLDKLSKIEKTLDGYEDMNQRLLAIQNQQKAAQEQADKIELALNRPRKGEDTQADEKKTAFFNFIRRGEQKMMADEVKILIAADDTQSGYMAPPVYVADMIKAVTEISSIRSIARVRAIGSKSIQLPRRTGQFTAQWVGEIDTRNETTGLTTGLEEIPAHELYADVRVSTSLLEDSVFDVEAFLQEEFASQFAQAEGAAFVTGNAVNKPEGFMFNSSILSTNSGSAATIADANGQANGIISLFYAIKTDYSKNGTFVLNRTTLGALRALQDSQRGYIWQPGLAMNRPNTILDAPYLEVPDMPNPAANAFPIAFGDFRRAYTIVDRVSLAVMRDPYTLAGSGQVKFLARRRVGGQVVLPEAIRWLRCST